MFCAARSDDGFYLYGVGQAVRHPDSFSVIHRCLLFRSFPLDFLIVGIKNVLS